MITRREWLTQNPPPRAAKSTQGLLDGLNKQNAGRAELVQLRQKWMTHRDYWNSRSTLPGEAAQAQQQIADANRNISEADQQLETTKDIPGRIQQLTEELKNAARCPVHHSDLHRNMNRPEDMFTCESGPHHLLWARQDGQAKLVSLTDLTVPGLDYPITDGNAISRMEWLSKRPPISPVCPIHGASHERSDKRVCLFRKTTPEEDRPDVFRCNEAPDQVLLWQPNGSGAAALTVWPAKKKLPSLEDPI